MEILTTKRIMEKAMYEKIESLFPEMKPHTIRQISLALSDYAGDEIIKSNGNVQSSINSLSLEYEQNRKKFRDTINDIQVQSKYLLERMKKEALITYKTNPKTGKTELIGRSDVLTGIVRFLNEMNDVVMDFYENVYKISDDKSIQTNLFS